MNIFGYRCKKILEGETVSFPSCAKVNLFLDIKGRREDGYHLIKSLFVPVTLFDILCVKMGKSGGLSLQCNKEWFDKGNNSLTKAYMTFSEIANFEPSLEIVLYKNIPAGSGLGGASSNAAVLIKIMNELLGLIRGKKLSSQMIMDIALKVGADVPFFINPRPSLVEGVGEQIKEVRLRDDISLVIICPDIPFYTSEMYKEYDRLNRLTNVRKGDRYLAPFLGFEDVADSTYNVFESVLKGRKKRMIERLKRILREFGAEAAALSGSGSATFGLFRSGLAANLASKRISMSLKGCMVFGVDVLKEV